MFTYIVEYKTRTEFGDTKGTSFPFDYENDNLAKSFAKEFVKMKLNSTYSDDFNFCHSFVLLKEVDGKFIKIEDIKLD